MKAIKLVITLSVLLAAFLVGGVALADNSSVFDSVVSETALATPRLTVAINGTQATLSWSEATGATGYTLYYSLPPYTEIGNIPMGTQTSISVTLWCGAAFYVAVKAYDNVKSSGYSNIQDVRIPLCTFKNSLGQEFNLISAGTFTMGSPSDESGRYSSEGPQHTVTLTQSFYMQQTEVTQAQWEAVMASNPSYFSGCPTCPVESVSWNDVQDFIEAMNARGEGTYSLPTEAQWEYGARAGTTSAFYNGGITQLSCGYDPNLNVIGWYCYNAESKTHPVAQKTPNAWGLYDMSGNVWEWCQDWYDSSYYSSSPSVDPTGPSTGTDRVDRGGGWNSWVQSCRAANRSSFSPGNRFNLIGFRLVLSPGQQ